MCRITKKYTSAGNILVLIAPGTNCNTSVAKHDLQAVHKGKEIGLKYPFIASASKLQLWFSFVTHVCITSSF